MRLLILHDRISERGGSDRYVLSVLEALQGRAEVRLAAAQDDGTLTCAERGLVGEWVRIKGLDRKGFRPRGLQATLKAVARTVEAFRPDLIHVHNVVDPEVMALAQTLGRTIMTVQDHRVFCPGQGKIKPNDVFCDQPLGPDCLNCFREPDYGQRIIDLTARRLELSGAMDRITVLSRYMAGELAACGVDPAKISIIPPYPHGLTPQARFGAGGYHLLAGRLVRRKGLRVAFRAVELLDNPLPLVIAGDGPMAEETARAAAESGGRIEYRGWVDRTGMSRLLAGARSLWLPSLWTEPFGLVGLEALASGLPVVAANNGGAPEWLTEGKSGFLVRPGKAPALARAADKLAGDDNLAQKMGAYGQREAAARFSRELFQARLWQAYGDTLTGG